MKIHEKYIKRCIELAKNGLGSTYPNPMVGSVIVHNDKIIGEGWHYKTGEPHAEVVAINSVKDKSLLSEATIYVSLEPCSHFGKTPPCSDLIIRHKIPKVIIGTIDPFAKVSGNGIRKLKDAGINVIVGILEKECQELNKRFFTFHQKKRPYIVLKWAESEDGFIAPLHKDKKEPVWITNEFSRQLVHKWRSEEQAIMVGTKTVIDDNPRLNNRDWKGTAPVRVVIDRIGKITNDYFVKDQKIKTIFITEEENTISCENIIFENIIFDIDLPIQICNILYKHNIQSVIIEGGRHLLQSFIDAELWDEARLFKGPTSLLKGVEAPFFKRNLYAKKQIQKDELIYFFNND